MHYLNHLVKEDLVIGIPKLKFEKNKLCEACQNEKQVKNSFQSKNIVYTIKPLELLHMDLWIYLDHQEL